ncbi:MAG: hypothetical protein MJA31_06555, partial [Clostridia bacterium]|nr:hypothetical protein [Clostridia bacterium]
RNYKHYKAFKDTMTVRTWFNMVELAKRLEAVVNVDNVLIDTLMKQRGPIQSGIEQKPESQRIRELKNSKKELNLEVARLNAHKESLSKRKNIYAITMVLSVLALLIILGSYISYVQKNKEIIKKQKKNNKVILELKQAHQNDLSGLNSENEKLKKELQGHDEIVNKLNAEIDKLTEEKEMLENNASAMKQSYNAIKSKEAEKEEKAASAAPAVTEDELAEIRREINTLSEEVAQIINEKTKLEERLNQTNDELEKEKQKNSEIGGDIEGLLKKFKGDVKNNE